MSEAAVGYVDDVGLYLDHFVVAEAPAVQHAFGEILRNGVADGD